MTPSDVGATVAAAGVGEVPLPDDRAHAAYCGACGDPLGGSHDAQAPACARRLELEPPRYCVVCRRRMKVQVTPGSWAATCVVHGSVEHSTWH